VIGQGWTYLGFFFREELIFSIYISVAVYTEHQKEFAKAGIFQAKAVRRAA